MNKNILHRRTGQSYPTLGEALEFEASLSREQARFLIWLGAIYLNGRRVTFEVPVPQESYLRIHLKPRRFALGSEDSIRLILHETPDFLIAFKPRGLPTHPTLDNCRENLWAYLKRDRDILLTHRLDQLTSGLIVFAKTKKFQQTFHRTLANGRVQKTYYALTSGQPSVGPYFHYMAPDSQVPRQLAAEPRAGWKKCELIVVATGALCEGESWVQVQLLTGRTHQIRAQLAAIGTPLLGDSIYNGMATTKGQFSLVSAGLGFIGPERIRWEFRVKSPLLALQGGLAEVETSALQLDQT